MAIVDPCYTIYSNFEYILRSVGETVAPDKTDSGPQYTRCLTGIPHPFGNLVICSEQTMDDYCEMVSELEAWVLANQAPVGVILFPAIGLSGRDDILQERDWLMMDLLPGMWMEIPDDFETGPIAAEAELTWANDELGLEHVTRAVAEGYPLPIEAAEFFMKGIHLLGESTGGELANFLITIEGKPAACSSVCIQDGVAGIYCVATLEAYRGRGLGTAITRAAIAYAKKRGATHSLLHATQMGLPIYRKIGFKELCEIPVYGFGL
jgi:GNAT superfamily N-acetyltransferase